MDIMTLHAQILPILDAIDDEKGDEAIMSATDAFVSWIYEGLRLDDRETALISAIDDLDPLDDYFPRACHLVRARLRPELAETQHEIYWADRAA